MRVLLCLCAFGVHVRLCAFVCACVRLFVLCVSCVLLCVCVCVCVCCAPCVCVSICVNACVRVCVSVSCVFVFALVVGFGGVFVDLLYESPRRKPG